MTEHFRVRYANPETKKLIDEVNGFQARNDLSFHEIMDLMGRLVGTINEQGEIIDRAYHYMQSPKSYSLGERKFVFDGLERERMAKLVP